MTTLSVAPDAAANLSLVSVRPQAEASTRSVDMIAKLIAVCEQAAQGNFEPRVTNIDRDSELGRLAIAVNDCLDRADAFVREAAATLQCASEERFYRRVLLNGMVGAYRSAAITINAATQTMQEKSQTLREFERKRRETADGFESSIGDIAESLANSAGELRGASDQLAQLSIQATEKSDHGKLAADRLAGNVAKLAGMGPSLTAAEHEIGTRAAESSRIASEGVAKAVHTIAHMQKLGEATARVEQIVESIKDLARQTNMLSLNAAIEAARAGNAGLGFAVVASEVKKLSEKTTELTRTIRNDIQHIQESSTSVSHSLETINGTIREIDQCSRGISQAVEKQREVSALLQSSMSETNQCVELVTQAIAEASAAAAHTCQNAEELAAASDLLSERAANLGDASQSFLRSIRG